MNIYMLSAGIT